MPIGACPTVTSSWTSSFPLPGVAGVLAWLKEERSVWLYWAIPLSPAAPFLNIVGGAGTGRVDRGRDIESEEEKRRRCEPLREEREALG